MVGKFVLQELQNVKNVPLGIFVTARANGDLRFTNEINNVLLMSFNA
jgi:hypothetical protein